MTGIKIDREAGVLNVTWDVEDGYVLGGRSYTTLISLDELEGLNDEEIIEHIFEVVQGDFEQRVTFGVRASEEDLLAAIKG